MDYDFSSFPNEFIGLRQEQKDEYLLFYSGRADGVEQIVALIQVGANINTMAPFGYTPLMSAIFHGCQANVCLLIQAGANIEVTNEYGETAFSTAIHEKYLDLAFLLFSMMSSEQIKNELEYEKVMIRKLPEFSSSVAPDIQKFSLENNKKSFETLGVLFCNKHKKNPFAFFPNELKRFIYLKYLAVSTKMIWQQYCSKTINAHIILDHGICQQEPLILSSGHKNKKQSIEKRLASLTLREQTDPPGDPKKPITKKRGCVIF